MQIQNYLAPHFALTTAALKNPDDLCYPAWIMLHDNVTDLNRILNRKIHNA